MSVTIRDVARAAGVSTATVSKVINHSPSISQATIERVEDVIRQLDYRPNKRAQSFARKATRNILFLSELEHGVGFDNPHLFEMLAGAEAALARKDYGLLIKRINARELVNSFADIMDDEFVDGAIVHASVVSREVASLLTDTLFPYVVIGMPDFANRLCWIDTNNSVAGQIAAKVRISVKAEYSGAQFQGFLVLEGEKRRLFEKYEEAEAFAAAEAKRLAAEKARRQGAGDSLKLQVSIEKIRDDSVGSGIFFESIIEAVATGAFS